MEAQKKTIPLNVRCNYFYQTFSTHCYLKKRKVRRELHGENYEFQEKTIVDTPFHQIHQKKIV